MEIRLLTREELDQSLDLVWKVFCEYEAVNYTEDSRRFFYDAIHSKDYLDMLTAYGAFDESGFVGIIASRNKGSHVALFFVEGGHHRQGIGRKLWEAMLENSTADIITVHSSIYACEIYKKLGFDQIGEETEDGGIVYIPMEYLHFPDILHDNKDEVAYAAAKRIAAESESSDKFYKYIPEFAKLLGHKKSYVRIRALILCCSQARWDNDGIIAKYLPQMLKLLYDEKPTVVRQSLNALKEVVVFRPELSETIEYELSKIDVSGYKDSMIPLIKKDIAELRELIDEKQKR